MFAQTHEGFGVIASFSQHKSGQLNCMFQNRVKGQKRVRATSLSAFHRGGAYTGCLQTQDKSPNKDTIYNSSSLNVSFLTDVQLNKLPKAT